MFHNKPKYWGFSITEFYNRHQFSEFDVFTSNHSPGHIIPKNPNPGVKDGFEIFRQSMNAVTHLAGAWPLGLDTVSRNQVEFRWTEFMDSYPVTDYTTGTATWHPRPDVQEYAYYTGPTEGLEMFEVYINKDYTEIREQLLTVALTKGGKDE